MQLGGKPIKVKLKTDLTKYSIRCKIGSCGYTMPETKLSMWGWQDRFVAVRFDSGAQLDVLWDSIEIIDEEYLKEREGQKRKKFEELKTATDVILTFGPRGNFRYFSYKCGNGHHTTEFKEEADEIIDFLKKQKIEIKQIKERR